MGFMSVCTNLAFILLKVGETGRAVGVEHISELVKRSIETIKKGKASHLLESGRLSIHGNFRAI